jgi:hypothetical protein
MPSEFIRREGSVKPGFNIGMTLARKPTAGAVGIEIELEGKNLPHEDLTPSPWGYHVDHSLRGEDNGEYVLNKPIEFDDVPKALATLWKTFDKCKSSFDDSNRTSVHVHLNCQEFHLNRLTAFLALWYALEEPLTEFCGEHRVGNLFCLRAVDAPAIITHLRTFIREDGSYPLNEMLHYAGMNPNALHKFGSLEVRTLKGCISPEPIETWISILERLYKLSADFPDPREIPASFSSGGPLSFFDNLLGDKADIVRAGIGWSNQDISDAMYRGVRLAQSLCYCRDWDEFKAIEVKPDPFGRDSRKLAGKIAAQAVMGDSPAAPEAPTPPGGLVRYAVSGFVG